MPKLLEINLKEVFQETGHCYKWQLPAECHEGEKIGSDYVSNLQLFENEKLLGPASSPHDTIRREGKGAYSHWNGELYFSTSDNSDPRKNKRKYFIVVPLKKESNLDYQKINFKNSDIFHYVLRQNANFNETELHSIFTLQVLSYLSSSIDFDIKDKIILDVGASPCLGLDLILVLLGAKKVIANNILPLPEKLSFSFVKNIYFFLKLMNLQPKNIEEIFQIQDNECFFKSEYLEVYGNLSAENLKLNEPIDLIISTSVLEHIRNLEDVLRNLYRLSNPNTVHIHTIDARDHTNFKDPLKYLRYTEEEFLKLYNEEHNRTRHFEYLQAFEKAGFSIFKKKYVKPIPITETLNVDIFEMLSNGIESYYVNTIEELPICVTEEERRGFDSKYRSLSLQELSTQAFVFYAKALNS